MRRIPKPAESAAKVFALCTGGLKNANLSNRLGAVARLVAQASTDFEQAASRGNLHTVLPAKRVGADVTVGEMTSLYKSKLSKKGGPARPLYDKLLLAAEGGVCPLCAQRVVSTLDHHLPKAFHPALAVTPANLVPSCRDCNFAKLTGHPTSRSDQTFHPYFDDFGSDLWLVAVVKGKPPVLRFSVGSPRKWSDEQIARAKHHMKTFALDKLYAFHAAGELVGLREQLVKVQDASGEAGVQAFLSETATSQERGRPNSWQAATYRALASDNSFCAGGFRDIPAP